MADNGQSVLVVLSSFGFGAHFDHAVVDSARDAIVPNCLWRSDVGTSCSELSCEHWLHQADARCHFLRFVYRNGSTAIAALYCSGASLSALGPAPALSFLSHIRDCFDYLGFKLTTAAISQTSW